MVKAIGYIGSYASCYIGAWINRLSHLRLNGKFVFDRPGIRYRLGYWMACQYQTWMDRSYRIQKWAGNKSPWRTVNPSKN